MLARRHAITSALALLLGPWAARAQSAAPLKPLLAQAYRPGTDVTQYWVSEKYDGVRALWDGQQLTSRSGRRIAAPDWFIAKLPATALDGELWLARGQFDALSGAVRKAQPDAAHWQRIQYMVFEQPGGGGSFTERSARLRELVAAANWPQLQWAAQFRVKDQAQLQYRLTQVVADGGEGLMLHLADAPYVVGRSAVLLKLKPEPDAEATVVAYLPGRGKYQGQLGALVLKTEDGQRFKLGSGLTDALRKTPPPIGSVVTYSYRGVTPSGLPRFASFVRIHSGM